MTSLDRVLAALQGQAQPRPPFTMALSLYGAKLTGCPLSEYYRRPECYAEGQEAVVDLCAPDILFSPFALPLEGEAFGCELKFLPTSPPNIKKPAVRTADACMELPFPDIDSHPSILYLRETVRRMAGKYHGKTPICGIMTACVDLPKMLMGIDMWIETLLFAPDKATIILEKAHNHFVRLANALFRDGADFIGLATMATSPRVLFPKLIDTVILPALERSFQELIGPVVFHHGGNPMAGLLKSYLDLPNVAGFLVDHRDSLAEARALLGPERLLLGNLNGPTLSKTPMARVLQTVDTILKDRADDPFFIFSTSAADVPLDTPAELLRIISEKIRTFVRDA